MQNEPKYGRIVNYLKEKLNNGELVPGQQLPTEKMLAEQFNVSRITSKRALDELENESLIIKKKGSGSYVREIVEESPNNNENSDMNVIALVIPFGASFGNGMQLIEGLTKTLNEQSYFLTVHISNDDADEERRIINDLVQTGAKGIILYPVSQSKNIDLINRLLLDDFPIITIDKYYEGLPMCSVTTDNYMGSYVSTTHLIELGHKDIAFVTNIPLDVATSVRDRYMGFCKALKDHGLKLTDESFVYVNELTYEIAGKMRDNNLLEKSTYNTSSKIVRKIMEKHTAIQAVQDYLAVFLLGSAISDGISVPDELSIVGFDNIEISSYVEVPLTTVEQDFDKIGVEAGKQILQIIQNGKNENKRIVLPTELIVRKSTGFV